MRIVNGVRIVDGMRITGVMRIGGGLDEAQQLGRDVPGKGDEESYEVMPGAHLARGAASREFCYSQLCANAVGHVR